MASDESHRDQPDHLDAAERLTDARENTITAGDGDEKTICGWKHRGMSFQQLPDDPRGVLRISVGGHVGFGYCTFRGGRRACRTLLQQALAGMADQPDAVANLKP